MNPPGGISLIIHIFIVILGTIRRSFMYILKWMGVSDSKIVKFMKRGTNVLHYAWIERSLSLIIVTMILATISLSVFLSVRGAVEYNSNITFIAGLVSFVKSVL